MRYKMLKSLIHHIKFFFGETRQYEKEWEQRQSHQSNDNGDWTISHSDWIAGYWESINHPHRNYLIKYISEFHPNSVFEIGCNCGPNLRLLAKKNPECDFTGIDINSESITKGKIWLKQEGISNISLIHGTADDLSRYPDNSFDIVFSDAVLIYIALDKIEPILKELIRIAKKRVILLEWQRQRSSSFIPLKFQHYIFRRGLWAWDYSELLHGNKKVKLVSCEKITPDIWPDEYWIKYGSLITITLNAEVPEWKNE